MTPIVNPLNLSSQELRDRHDREVYDLRVYVVGGGFAYLQMFKQAGFVGARCVDDADIVCFTGGEDVNPHYYGERCLSSTHYNDERDQFEFEIFGEAIALQKPMIGICRGAQFLNVANGGSLYQHVDNHAISLGHDILHIANGEVIPGVTSTHHQQMIPAKGAEIIAVACESKLKMTATTTMERDHPANDDIEVLWYADTQCLCFQPHPEFTRGNTRKYFLELVDNYILPLC